MSDHYEKCGCEESIILRLAIREYVENNDDTRIRREYGETPLKDLVKKLSRVDEPLSINDRQRLCNEITKLKAENEVLLRARPSIMSSSEQQRVRRIAKHLWEKEETIPWEQRDAFSAERYMDRALAILIAALRE